MSEKEKIILDTSDEAATFKTGLSGWVDREGRFWGDNERQARYSGSTHRICDCGKLVSKSSYCETCHRVKLKEKYDAMSIIEWDCETPICEYDGDNYFFDEDSLIDQIIDSDIDIDQLMLVKCEPQSISQVDEDYFSDDQHEDFELPEHIQKALDDLNKIIRETPPVTFYPGNTAIKLPDCFIEQIKQYRNQKPNKRND